MPEGYGLEQAEGFLEWEEVESRLEESRNYWLSTTRPDGRPHAVPRWGVWLDGMFWYDGDPKTLHARNLTTNPGCVLHLEDGMEVTIVEGRSVRSEPIIGELGERLAGEYIRKYAPTYTPEPDSWSDDIAGGMRKVVPTKVLAWTEFPKDLTRFTF
jgi:hypothetical protein